MSNDHPGRRIRAARRAADLTQQQVSDMTGIPRSALAGVERGHLPLWPKYRAKIGAVAVLGLTDLL